MKKTAYLLLASCMISLFASLETVAQSNKEEIELIQSIFGMEKKQAVAEFLELAPDNPFWPLYDEYESKRKALGAERIAAIGNYAEKYGNMQAADFGEVVAGMISLRKRNDKLVESYYKKIKKASGPKVAAQFFQIEEYILSEIRSAVLGGLPFIGEFEK